jgi:hypothetical protein
LGVIILYISLAKIQKELEEVGKVYAFTLEGLDKTPSLLQAEGTVEVF